VASVESSGRSDSEVATESWLAHIRRNQSIITDLMTGQYKSKVTCPTCQKESITFDPFITVTLPISERITNNFECFVFKRNFEERTRKINFAYGKPSLPDWRKSISKATGIKEEALEIYLVTIYEGIYQAGRDSLADIVYKMENENKNVFVFELTEEERRIVDRVELPSRLAKKAYYHSSEFENIWFKFPLFFERNSTTGRDIYRRVLAFLFPTAYSKKGDFQAYEELMLQKRPFSLVLKYNRKVDRHYSRLEYRYSSEKPISDETTLEELWELTDSRECELDIRFTEQGLASFEVKNLKDYDDISKKSKGAYEGEGASAAVELKDCFDNLSEEEELERGNEWYCSHCKEHKLAKKVIQIYKAPKVLILHLKRFKNKGTYRKEKNESRVLFPETLDMAPYLIDQSPLSSYAAEAGQKGILIAPKHNGPQAVPCSDRPLYDLYAVSNHYGGMGGGHYTAYGKNGSQWLDFNDSSVREVSRESIQGSSAYMLFYKRRDE
jgi:ubiquitin carboxyl-terminal hydrolase 4/11